MMPLPEFLAALSAGLLIIIYHIKIYLMFSRRANYLALTRNIITKQIWAKKMLAAPNRELIAVQTLRNGQLGASLLASSTLLVGISVGTAAFRAGTTLLIIKLGLIAALFYLSFFFFVWSLRCVNHLSYSLCLIPSDIEKNNSENATETDLILQITPENHVANIQNSLKWYVLNFHFGLRCFYFAVPLVLFLINGYYMLFGSIAILFALSMLDYNC
eukprot:TRINITY_DN8746_c0_g1_i1.p1 TRINITY_DN8746_c0_g1~~TRINITY_DN8746_c0_g1_i1.p1  ORF type:complete len:216 (-),score=58.70 TRINITY_DN8746_c0_g1_i1:21-668(-)